jgi:hypothetical protein
LEYTAALDLLPGKPTTLAEILASVNVKLLRAGERRALGAATGADQSRGLLRPDVLVKGAVKAVMGAVQRRPVKPAR